MQSCKEGTPHQAYRCGRAFRVGGKPGFLLLFYSTGCGFDTILLRSRCCVFTAEVKQTNKKTKQNWLVSLSRPGHGKLIWGQNATVKIQLVNKFMELLQAAPTCAFLFWVYQPQRSSLLALDTGSHISQLVPPSNAKEEKEKAREQECGAWKQWIAEMLPVVKYNSCVYSTFVPSLCSCFSHCLFVY